MNRDSTPPGWRDLTAAQQQILVRAQEACNFETWGYGLRDAVAAEDVPDADKAAVARFVAGPVAAREFEETTR